MALRRGGREPRSAQWSRRKMLTLLAMAALTVAVLAAGLVLAVVHAVAPTGGSVSTSLGVRHTRGARTRWY